MFIVSLCRMNRRGPLGICGSVVLFCATLGCGAPSEKASAEGAIALGQRYERDSDYRRQALISSLVSVGNAYATRRLQHYTDADWGALPKWNPRSCVVDVSHNGVAPPESDPAWSSLEVESVPWDEHALIELGRRAFFRYPLQVSPYLRQALADPASFSRYGLWLDDSRVAGTVWTELPRNSAEPALTCATCHATVERAGVVEGKNNASLDIEALVGDYHGGAAGPSRKPGRVDVTGDGVDNPTAIADLRSVRSQVNLHRAATLRNDLVSLAIRIETLVITSLDEAVRPPRKLAFALAMYLWQLEPTPLRAMDDAAMRGRAVFTDRCAGCHRPPEFSGPAVPLEIVGTDPLVGMSPERTTGLYRVPSLRGVGDRHRLLANGEVYDATELLNPERTTKGHVFGLDLTLEAKENLLSYLETL